MGIKIKFLTPVSQGKFLHNLVNAKKSNPNYKHIPHKLLEEAKDKVSFRITDDDGKNIVYCDIDFFPEDNMVYVECQPGGNPDALQSLLLFDLLESINEKAVIRFFSSLYFFNGGMELYFVSGGPRQKVHKVSSNRNDLLEVGNSRIIAEITQVLEEIKPI